MNYSVFFQITLIVIPLPTFNELIVDDVVLLKHVPVASYCQSDTQHVIGESLPSLDDQVELLQDASCTEWISTKFPARCAVFNAASWAKSKSKLLRHHLDFCIDTFEYPNAKGSLPKVFVSYNDAKNVCNSIGKRICTEEEWTFACEGEEGLPYPYGYERNTNTCNIDHRWIEPDTSALQNSKLRGDELKRLWQGVPSGSMETCVSPYGVHDMTGNIDELTTSVRKTGFRSVLKGGYWSTVRNRCRPATRIHDENFAFYQEGLRCCTNVAR